MTFGGVAQLARVREWHSRGHGFDSRHLQSIMSDKRSADGVFSGDIDPEIADLMGIESEDENAPEFNDLFDEGEAAEVQPEEVDLSRERFPEITRFEEAPKPFFRDKNFYKKVLGGEGDASKKVHDLLTKFLKAEDPQDKSMFRNRLIPAYWDLASRIARKVRRGLPVPKQLLLRFGVLLPTLISAEQRDLISKIIMENDTGEPIYYVDEWLEKVGLGQITASATDETKVAKKDEGQRAQVMLEKSQGQYEVQLGLVKGKLVELDAMEEQLIEKAKFLNQREDKAGFPGMKDGYNPLQRSAIGEATELLRKMSTIDKELDRLYGELHDAHERLEDMKTKAEELGAELGVDSEGLVREFNTVRQMAKLCVGRQGNHIPFLMKQYLRANMRNVGTRENIIREMAAIEEMDPGIFMRTFKRQTNRIIPHIILVPCYGERGICWEPFERFNKATSRGRVAVPLYPKDLRSAILYALGDLRWQVAKEWAQHYWMEEGLTGKYYQYFTDKKLRGDVRESFISDYVLWITKESEGTQKLDREARGVFWRNVPFPQEIKDKLKNRGFVYNDLYKKDVNISMSDGY